VTDLAPSLATVLDALRGRGEVVRRGAEWVALCPAHDDHTPSLSVTHRGGAVLFRCRSHGCTFAQIVRALGLDPGDCFDAGPAAKGDYSQRLGFEHRVERAYWYHAADGAELFQVVRLAWPKDFRQRRRAKPGEPSRDGWVWKTDDLPRVPYRLPGLLAADRAAVVYVVEGEKDADALTALGLVATTNPGGAGKWMRLHPSTADAFAGRRVAVLPDNDDPGRRHAREVAGSLAGTAARVAVLALPGLADKGDASDWLAAGGTAAELGRLADRALAGPAGPAAAAGLVFAGPPLPLDAPPPAAPFPLHTLPGPAERLYRQGAEALNVPVEYLAVPGLAVLGAAAGRSVAARRTRSHAEVPALWTAVVGGAGTTKSAAVRLAAGPLWAAERGWRAEHAEAVADWEAAREAREQAARQWRAGGKVGDRPACPPRPVCRQVLLDQFTGEALGRVLAANPRGMIACKDELAGLVGQLDKYRNGKGDDRQNLLSAWAGAPFKVNRSKDGEAPPLWVPHPFLAVAGVLTPDSLRLVRGDRGEEAAGDGWADRFLWSWPDPVAPRGETWLEVPDDVADGYAALVGRMLGAGLVSPRGGAGDDPHPRWVPFDAGGRRRWEAFAAELAGLQAGREPDDPFRGVLHKLLGYGLRLAALLWAAWHADGAVGPDDGLGAELVGYAAELVGYFRAHAERCWQTAAPAREARVARRLVAWLEREPGRHAFTWREAMTHLRDRRDVTTAESLTRPLRLCEDSGYIQPLPCAERPGPGRPPGEAFAVNPLWRRAEDAERCHTNHTKLPGPN
jgi:hypothetical protein